MSSFLVRGRSRTLGNRSASETDLSSNFRRRSVQSINKFSLRRMLCTEPAIHSLRLTSNDAENLTGQAGPIRPPENNGLRRTNRGHVIMPQPFSSSRRSHQDQRHIPTPAIIVLHPTHDSGTISSPPQHHRRDLASTNTAGKLSSSLSPPAPLTSILKPMFTGQLQLSHNMGNHLSSALHHGRRKENQSPEANLDPANPIPRPASSPAPPVSGYLSSSIPVVIPDRRSSITPRPSNASGNVSPARTIRPGDLIDPSRCSMAPGTKPSHKDHLAAQPAQSAHASEVSSLINPNNGTVKAPAGPSDSLAPRRPAPFPQLLTLSIPTPAPPLTLAHFACYHSHRRMSHSPNVHNPVPCMTCGVESGDARWKCQWCCLRICPACMERLAKIEDRDVARLVQRLEEEGRAFLGGSKEEWGDGNGRMWNDGRVGEEVAVSTEMGTKEEKYDGGEPSAATGVIEVAVGGQGKDNENQEARVGGGGGGGGGSRGVGGERRKRRERPKGLRHGLGLGLGRGL